MIRLFCFVLAVLASSFKSKVRLEAENAVLRHQLIVLRRRLHGRVRLTNHDRWFLIQLYRWFPSILQILTIIRPETLVRWHRAGFRCYWRWKSRPFVLTPETEVGPEGRRSLKANEPFNIATVEFNGLRWHPAFTAKERISTYLTEPETCLGAKARDLFALLPKSNFWLNPRSECQKPLRAEEIALIMNRKIFDIDFAGAAKPSN
jgi:hypothetical protein